MVTLNKPAAGDTDWTTEINDNWTSIENSLGTDIGCRVNHSADQSIASGTITTVSFDSERYDTDGMHDTATNNSRITFNKAGKYLVFACVRIASNSTGVRYVAIRKNGGSYIAIQYVGANPQDFTGLSVATVANFAASDYVEVQVYQNSGGSLALVAIGEYSPEFAAQKMDKGG